MTRKLTHLAAVALVFSLSSPLAMAQVEEYDFDGLADEDPQPADPTDWMTSVNWGEGGFDPIAPLLPGLTTRVEIEDSKYGANAPVIGPGDAAEAYGVRIGRTGGEGLLTMTGGTLDISNACVAPFFNCNRRLRVGNDDSTFVNPGTFDLMDGVVNTDTLWIGSGTKGTMNMSGGTVNTRGQFYFDWTFDAGSMLNMTGGTINVGTVFTNQLAMHRNSSLNLDGGEIFVSGAARLGTELDNPQNSAGGQQTPAVTVSITDGLLEASNFLQIGGSVTVDGGILRADSFNEVTSVGTVEINGSGLLQFNNAQETVVAVEALVAGGVFTTTDASGLVVEIVDVGGTDFTQVSVVSVGIAGDFDGDGDIDGKDFLDIQRNNPAGIPDWESNFGTVPLLSAVRAVPEPGSLALTALAGVVLLCKSRNYCH